MRDAIEHSDSCIGQNMFNPDESTQSENCLTLNVYVPGDIECFNFERYLTRNISILSEIIENVIFFIHLFHSHGKGQ